MGAESESVRVRESGQRRYVFCLWSSRVGIEKLFLRRAAAAAGNNHGAIVRHVDTPKYYTHPTEQRVQTTQVRRVYAHRRHRARPQLFVGTQENNNIIVNVKQ